MEPSIFKEIFDKWANARGYSPKDEEMWPVLYFVQHLDYLDKEHRYFRGLFGK
jgi:hypothetical protein